MIHPPGLHSSTSAHVGAGVEVHVAQYDPDRVSVTFEHTGRSIDLLLTTEDLAIVAETFAMFLEDGDDVSVEL